MILKRRKGSALVETSKGILVVSGKNKKFMLPGGKAEKNESRKKAAIRELYEETGLKSKKAQYFSSYVGRVWKSYSGKFARNYTKVFIIEAIGNARPRNEIRYIDYWKPGSKLNLTYKTKEVIKKYIKK